jgi:hypothetical protein
MTSPLRRWLFGDEFSPEKLSEALAIAANNRAVTIAEAVARLREQATHESIEERRSGYLRAAEFLENAEGL